ncbi:hypothetical protein GYMLUDRAFT_36377 [Collybiopsis luxurians FD-317 M1]|nr:hypothetical protein GYMLUDRAFT_36377 [Collybiopsis luxurians FD-317 M1]
MVDDFFASCIKMRFLHRLAFFCNDVEFSSISLRGVYTGSILGGQVLSNDVDAINDKDSDKESKKKR